MVAMSVHQLFVGILCFLTAGSTFGLVYNIAEPGGHVILPCEVSSNVSNVGIFIVYWARLDLEPQYVNLYRDNQSDPENQHPSFHGRVELNDPQMKDGDASLILKNINIKDTGTYKCYVRIKGRRPQVLNTITLTVRPSGHTAGTTENETDKGGEGTNGNSRKPFVPIGIVIAAAIWFLILMNP